MYLNENVKFAPSDVLQETLWQRLLLGGSNNWQPQWQILVTTVLKSLVFF